MLYRDTEHKLCRDEAPRYRLYLRVLKKVLGAPSGFNLKSSRVTGPVKECPSKCTSPGNLAHGSLIFFVTELSDPTRCPPFAFLTNCFSSTTLCTYPSEHRSIIFTSDVQKISRFGFSLALHAIEVIINMCHICFNI